MIGQLSAKLASYGTAASRYQHNFSFYISQDFFHIYLYLISSKQILRIHGSKLRHTNFSVDQLKNTRHCQDFAAGRLANIQKLFPDFFTDRRHGQNNFIYVIFLHRLENLFSSPDDLDAIQIPSPFTLIVIDQTTDFIFYIAAGFILTNKRHPCCPGTYYHYLFSLFLFLLMNDRQIESSEQSIAYPDKCSKKEK